MKIVVSYDLKETVEKAVIGISIFRNDGLLCYGTHTLLDGIDEFDITKSGKIIIDIDRIGLIQSEYYIDFAITSNINDPVDYYKNAIKFQIFSEKEDIGVTKISHVWSFEEEK